MTSTKRILDRIRALRKEMGFKQEDLAKELGIDRTTFVKKEQGLIPISTEEWLKIANTLSINFADIFHATEKELVESPERLLTKLYRSLNREEKQSFISSINLLLKNIRRKRVQNTLKKLIEK